MQADVQPTATRPDPPKGHVYLADVLDIVRRHAESNGWCYEAEMFVRDTFGLTKVDMPDRRDSPTYCCTMCDGSRMSWEIRNRGMPGAWPRLTLADPTRTVRVGTLKDAVRRGIDAYADEDDDQGYSDMFGDVIDMFRLPIDKP